MILLSQHIGTFLTDIPPAPNRALDWVSASLQPLVLGGLSLLALGIFLGLLWPKILVMRMAAPEPRFDRPSDRIFNVLSIALAQTRLFKESVAGWMHALIFWGFLVLLLRAGQFFLIGFFPAIHFNSNGLKSLIGAYMTIKDVFVLLVTGAVGYALLRRLVLKPARLTLSGEGILILGLILVIMASDILFDAAWLAQHPQSGERGAFLGLGAAQLLRSVSHPGLIFLHNLAYWSHVTAILFFITLLPRSKHFHIITSIPNVYFSNVTGKGNSIHRLDFEDESRESFGVASVADFSWKALLDFHTCTECGRCDVYCPALNSGKPLSPQKLTVDLRDHLNRETPRLLDPARASEATSVPLLGGIIEDETLWSCTTCGACEEECPVTIEYVNRVIDMRRGLVLTENRYPREFTAAFRSLETNGNPWGFGRDSRADWARGLDLKLWDRDHPTEYLYFIGCNGSFDQRGQKIARSVVAALRAAGVEFSILGTAEGCTGDPARRAGNEYLFDLLATQNAATFKEQGVIKIVTHCPHCLNSLKNEYPEFGVHLEVIHHSELLDRLIRDGKISPAKEEGQGKVVYHDSCYLGRHNGIYDAPRGVIAATTAAGATEEVEQSRERGTCCGAGGARFLLEEKTGTRMSHNRIGELMQANPDTIAVSCPFCVLMLEDGLKAKGLQGIVKVKDISEL